MRAVAANVFTPEWDSEVERPPYRWRRSFVGRRAGRELLVVLEGTLVLRTLAGEERLEPGDVVACPRGRDGAHRLDNRGAAPARVLIVSTMHGPDINEFPDSNLLWARSWAPGSDPPDGGVQLVAGPDGVDPLALP
jgi:uncharacterized cupin superfamily protein